MTGAAAATDLARRLERFRAARLDDAIRPEAPLPHARIPAAELAARLATTLDGEVVESASGRYVRVEGRSTAMALDRERLATLPGQPAPDRPLVCLDTETTGLATAAGTVAFLIGLGWWEGDTFRQVQLLLPDHGEERAVLDALADHIPADAWLVTYNGRGFDWPLLVTRYRLARRAAPEHDGHLDLLPLVRRVFRHRMDDARLRTAERTLLGLIRHDDVDGWEIPGRYLGFLRGGPAQALAAVVRHNDEDVRSLARLLALLERGYATSEARRGAPAGDLAGLARAFVRARRPADALSCLDEVMGRPGSDAAAGLPRAPADDVSVPVEAWGTRRDAPASRVVTEPWWSPRVRPDFGGRPARPAERGIGWDRRVAAAAPWDGVRIATDRAHLLRRLERWSEAAEAWGALAAGPGRTAIVATVELAKLYEHRLGRPDVALQATTRGLDLAERRRHLGMPEPRLEADLARRLLRLRRRAASDRRRLDRDLRRRGRDDQPADPLAHGPSPDGQQVRDPAQAHVLDRQ
jgi:uncharacterized protein YprB with RNaseH-like and TPR domain